MLHLFSTGYTIQINLKPTMAESAKGESAQVFRRRNGNRQKIDEVRKYNQDFLNHLLRLS